MFHVSYHRHDRGLYNVSIIVLTSCPENQRVIIMEIKVSPKMSQCQVMKIKNIMLL